MRIALTILLASGIWCGLLAYESRIERKAFEESLVLSLSSLPEAWELQTTVDLTNWFSVVRAGELAPKNITIHIASSNAAQFYRIQ